MDRLAPPQSTRLPSLVHLGLGYNGLDDALPHALRQGGGGPTVWPSLISLDLGHNRMQACPPPRVPTVPHNRATTCDRRRS